MKVVAPRGSGEFFEGFLLLQERDPGTGGARRFVALEQATKEEVELTWLPGAGARVDEGLEACRRQRELMAEGLEPLLEARALEGGLLLVRPWAATIPLAGVLAAGPLGFDLACRVLFALAATLGELHGRGLVHGDLRPATVACAAGGALRLAGMAPASFRGALWTAADDQVVPRYAAPEWHRMRTPLATEDVYSLGLVAYELFTGRPLFPAGPRRETLERQRKPKLRLYRGVRIQGDLPAKLGRLLERMLAFERAARPASAQALVEELEDALAGSTYRRPVGELLAPRLAPGLREARARLEGRARQALAAGDELGAAACLREWSGLGEVAGAARGDWDRLWIEVLWWTFREAPPATEVAAVRARREATAALALRAARQVEARVLAGLARLRLDRLADRDGPLGPLLSPPREAAEVERDRVQLRQLVQQDLASPEAALGLAVLEDELSWPRDRSLASLRAELFARHGLHAAAVLAGAEELKHTAPRRAALEALAVQVELALGQDTVPPSPCEDEEHPAERLEASARLGAAARRPLGDGGVDLEVLEGRVRRALAEEDLSGAAEGLALLGSQQGRLRGEPFARTCRLLRDFLWKALLPSPLSPTPDRAVELVLQAATGLGLEGLVPVCEALLVELLPESERGHRLGRLLEASEGSVLLTQAAWALGRPPCEDATWVRHLVFAGDAFLRGGELQLASKMYMAARALHPDEPRAAAGLQQVFELGVRLADAGRRLEEVAALLARNPDRPGEALAACKGLLAVHPTHRGALEAVAELEIQNGNRPAAARVLYELALRALQREETERARELLHRVLVNDPENEDALLQLAVLAPPRPDSPREIWRLRLSLLEAQGLYDSALILARRELRGEADDYPVLAMLERLSRRAGHDPSPLLMRQGLLAWEAGDPDIARDRFEEALLETTDPEALVNDLIQREGIEEVFTAEELLGLTGPEAR